MKCSFRSVLVPIGCALTRRDGPPTEDLRRPTDMCRSIATILPIHRAQSVRDCPNSTGSCWCTGTLKWKNGRSRRSFSARSVLSFVPHYQHEPTDIYRRPYTQCGFPDLQASPRTKWSDSMGFESETKNGIASLPVTETTQPNKRLNRTRNQEAFYHSGTQRAG